MSLGRGGERVAPVFLEASANNVDSCAGGELRARHSPAVYSMWSMVVGVGCCRALMAPPAAKVTPDTQGHGHHQISATSASFWKTASNGDGARLVCEGRESLLVLMDRQIEPVSDVVLSLLRRLAPWFRPCGMLRR